MDHTQESTELALCHRTAISPYPTNVFFGKTMGGSVFAFPVRHGAVLVTIKGVVCPGVVAKITQAVIAADPVVMADLQVRRAGTDKPIEDQLVDICVCPLLAGTSQRHHHVPAL